MSTSSIEACPLTMSDTVDMALDALRSDSSIPVVQEFPWSFREMMTALLSIQTAHRKEWWEPAEVLVSASRKDLVVTAIGYFHQCIPLVEEKVVGDGESLFRIKSNGTHP